MSQDLDLRLLTQTIARAVEICNNNIDRQNIKNTLLPSNIMIAGELYAEDKQHVKPQTIQSKKIAYSTDIQFNVFNLAHAINRLYYNIVTILDMMAVTKNLTIVPMGFQKDAEPHTLWPVTIGIIPVVLHIEKDRMVGISGLKIMVDVISSDFTIKELT